MSTDLPTLYAAVCAKRPELAVMSIGATGVRMYYDAEYLGWYWDDPAPKHIGDRFAAALILARWVEALPVGFLLYQRTPGVWECDWINDIWDDTIPPKNIGPTPLAALAAFYLGETA